MKIVVILPAFNERAALETLIPAIGKALQARQTPFLICVVDDGSTDGTDALVQALSATWPIVRLPHEHNQGYGMALKTGFRWILEHCSDSDVAVSLDADNTHPPEYLSALLAALNAGCDVVTASYSLPGAEAVGVPWQRRIMSVMANFLLACRYRIPGVRTYTNGFRAYRVQTLRRTYETYPDTWITQKGFAGGTELFINVCRSGARPGEIPFVLHYENRGGGSKINIPKTIASYLRLMLPKSC